MVSVSGCDLFVRQSGQGPDVVLLHGMGDSSIGWQFVEAPLAKAGYRVTVWDALGTGRSEKPADGDYHLPAHARRLFEVLDALEVRRAVLVGNSLGGSLALLAAQEAPERVQGLVLLNPAAYREGAVGDAWFWDVPLLAEVLLKPLPARVIARFGLRQNFTRTDAVPESLIDLYSREAARDGGIDAFIAQERQLVPPGAELWEARHRSIACPVLILWGDGDRILPVTQAHRLAADLPNASLVFLAGAGHAAQLEAPERVLDHLLGFLDGLHQTSSGRSAKQ
jgi:pimeloyl-ACP methyl ester carboxylesterase